MANDPFAAYGGSADGPPPTSAASEVTDPFAAFGGSADKPSVRRAPSVPAGTPGGVLPKPASQIGTQGTIAPYHPGFLDRARNVVANSAIGHALEQGLPHVADELNLHPSETVNSPTYAEHTQEPLALDELMPANPRSAAGNVGKGILRGVSQMGQPQNAATMAGIAATGGLAAPFAEGAGALGAAGKIGQNALKFGLAKQGAEGLYRGGKHAVDQYSAGDIPGAEQSVGEMIPNAAMMLPAAGRPIESSGEGMQAAGEGLINQTIGARDADYKRQGNPGRGYFQNGTGPSASMSGIAERAENGRKVHGAAIGKIVGDATSRGAAIPAQAVMDALRETVGDAIASREDQGGTGNAEDFRNFLNTFQPTIDAAARGESLTPNQLWKIRRNIDRNTSWRDPTKLDLTQVRQQASGALGGLLEDAVPGLAPLNERYRNSLMLRNRAQQRANTGSGLGQLAAKGLLTGIGAALGDAHGSLGALGGAAGGAMLESVPARTAAASALTLGGRGIAALGRGIARASRPLTLGVSADSEPDVIGNADNDEGAQQPFNGVNQAAPLTNPSRLLPSPEGGQTAPEATAPQSLRERLLQNYRLRQQQAAQYRPYRDPAGVTVEQLPARGTITVSPEGAATRGPAANLPILRPPAQLPAPTYEIPTGEPPVTNETPGALISAERFPVQNVGEARVIRNAQGQILPRAQRNVEFPGENGKLPIAHGPNGRMLSQTPTRQAYMAGSGQPMEPPTVSGPGVLLRRGAELPDQDVKVLTAAKGGGKPISDYTMRAFLQKAGGDEAKARTMAEKKGWTAGPKQSAKALPGSMQSLTPEEKAQVEQGSAEIQAAQKRSLDENLENARFTPETHSFSVKAWKAANPRGDVVAAKTKAEKLGYEVTE